MFTGIIRELGTVARVERVKGLVRLAVYAPKTAPGLEPMESIAVHGVCVTVAGVHRRVLTVELIQETQRLTTLSTLRAGDRVHLEPSLTLSDRLGGHLLLGHVDGLGTVVTRRARDGELVMDIRVPHVLQTFVVPKGSVAVNGVSLTVAALTDDGCEIAYIPHTLAVTTAGSYRAGRRVNLEVDLLARYLARLLDDAGLPGRKP